MKDFAATVEGAMMEWWTANGEREGLVFRFNQRTEQRIHNARPHPWPIPKGSSRMTKFLGMRVWIDNTVPPGEIHIADATGKSLGKIVGLDRV